MSPHQANTYWLDVYLRDYAPTGEPKTYQGDAGLIGALPVHDGVAVGLLHDGGFLADVVLSKLDALRLAAALIWAADPRGDIQHDVESKLHTWQMQGRHA